MKNKVYLQLEVGNPIVLFFRALYFVLQEIGHINITN